MANGRRGKKLYFNINCHFIRIYLHSWSLSSEVNGGYSGIHTDNTSFFKVMILISAQTKLHYDFGTNVRSQVLVQTTITKMLINYSILEPIDNFISITAGKVIAWNAAGEAGKTAVDGN